MSARTTSIEFRTGVEEKRRLQNAAKTLGLDLSAFIRMAALKEAAMLETHMTQIRLSDADTKVFLDALETETEPTSALVELLSEAHP